jgi:predicted amidohydrolase
VQCKGWRICPLICYDLRFPVWSRNREDFDILVYVANWPKARRKAWEILLQARAIENQVYVVGVNRIGEDGQRLIYSGDSMVVDASGEVLSRAQPEKPSVETVCLSYKALEDHRMKFQVGLDADDFEVK